MAPGENDLSFWRKGGRTELLESKQGRLESGQWFHAIYPTGMLLEWLQSYTKSWAYFHEVSPGGVYGYHRVPNGVLFAFEEASDAVLFKMTWS